MKRILFTGGGSAGHVVPNVALIEDILVRNFADVCYIGTNGIEKTVVAPLKLPYYQIDCPKLLRGGGFSAFKKNLTIPFAFIHAVKQAKKGLRLLQPDAVFSKGGYVALPVVFAAHRLKIPCFAHESDFSAGLANKLSAKYCQTVFTSFPETAKNIKHGVYSGAPMKRSLFTADPAQARKQYQIEENQKVLLIFGGGSGSVAINQAVRAQLKALCEKYVILHVCGKGNVIDCNIKNYRQFEFIKDMGGAYACADVVVSRAGAGATFEVLALKKPTLFIPLEGQTRGDQAENAKYFEHKGLCHVLKQTELSSLTQAIAETFADTQLRQRLQRANVQPANDLILQTLAKAIGIDV